MPDTRLRVSMLSTVKSMVLALMTISFSGSVFSSTNTDAGTTPKSQDNHVWTGRKDVRMKLIPLIELPQPGSRPVGAVRFSPDGVYLAAKVAGDKVNVWNWRQKRIIAVLDAAKDESNASESLIFSPDGKLLVSSYSRDSRNVVATIWSTISWKIVSVIVDPLPGDTSSIGFTKDGAHFLRTVFRMPKVSGDNVVLYNTSNWKTVWSKRTVPFYPYSSTFGDSEILIAGIVNNPLQWNSSNPKPAFGNPPLPDGPIVAVYSVVTGEVTKIFSNPAPFGSDVNVVLNDRKTFYTASGDGIAAINAVTGKSLFNIPSKFVTGLTGLQLSHNSLFLVESKANHDGSKGYIRIRRTTDMQLSSEIAVNAESLALSSDDQFLATGLEGKTVVWQMKNVNQ